MIHAWLDTDAYVECRVKTGHKWKEIEDCGLDGAEWGSIQRCTSCRTKRHLWWNIWHGNVTARWYEYPEGYTVQYGAREKRLYVRDYRVLYFRQQVKRRRLTLTKGLGARHRRKQHAA
jgi:hypothetical protein